MPSTPPDTSTSAPTVQSGGGAAGRPVHKRGSQGVMRELRRGWRRPPRHPWLTGLIVLVVLLLLTEGWVRWVSAKLPSIRAGDAAEMILKAERINEMSEKSRHVDVVFFGSSIGDSAVDTDTFLSTAKKYKSVYNAGVVGAPAATQVRWANEIVFDRLDPTLIVLDIHPIDLLLNDVLNLNVQPAQADMVFSRVLRDTGSGPVAGADRWLNDHVEIVKQRGLLRRPKVMLDATVDTVLNNPVRQFPVQRDEAFWSSHLSPLGESSLFHGSDFAVTGVKDQLRQNMRTDAFSVRDIYRLFDVATGKEGAATVVVIPPIPLQAWQEVGVDLKALRSGDDLIKSIAAEYRVPVIDFTDSGYENDLFADLVHTNDKGAERFSRDLGLTLNSR